MRFLNPTVRRGLEAWFMECCGYTYDYLARLSDVEIRKLMSEELRRKTNGNESKNFTATNPRSPKTTTRFEIK